MLSDLIALGIFFKWDKLSQYTCMKPKRKLTHQELQPILCEESDSDVDFKNSVSEYSTETSNVIGRFRSAAEIDCNRNMPCDIVGKNGESQPVAYWVNVTPDGCLDFQPKYKLLTKRNPSGSY